MKHWTKNGSPPVPLTMLPFRLMRETGPDAGHTVTEIWNWPEEEIESVLAECGYTEGEPKPDDIDGHSLIYELGTWVHVKNPPTDQTDMFGRGTL